MGLGGVRWGRTGAWEGQRRPNGARRGAGPRQGGGENGACFAYGPGPRADRGSTFASEFASNPSGSVGDAFISSQASLTEGGGCSSDGYNAGGFNGCGCNAVIGWDHTSALASFHATSESWTELSDDGYDAATHNKYTWNTVCNYNTTTYPFSKP